MITSLGITKFKAFKTFQEVRLPALTVLSGKNSSGKSSILQSLLLLKQSMKEEMPNEALILDGQYLQYTHLKEISFGLPQEAVAAVSFNIGITGPENELGELRFEIRHKFIQPGSKRKGPVVNKFSWVIKDGSKSITQTIRLRNGIYQWPEQVPLQVPPLPKEYERFGEIRIEFEHFLPAYLLLQAHKPGKNSSSNEVTFRLPLDFVQSPVVQLIRDFRSDLNRLRYLGPSRAVPRRAYIHYSEMHYDLDEDGGNAAHVFWLRRNEKVRFRHDSMSLKVAVQECMTLMGLEQHLTPKRSSKIVYQILVGTTADPDRKVTLADVGFGYSQVLPIVLRGLLADEGALLLFEQPEIHLHPSAKAKLADLFLAFVESGKRIMVETHSTEFINGLQLHAIRNPKVIEDINVVFIEYIAGATDEGASVRELQLQSDGLFESWPKGFCDESELLARQLMEESVKHREEID